MSRPTVTKPQDALEQTDVELEAAGTPTDDGPGFQYRERAIVRQPSVAGSERSDTETTVWDGGVAGTTIVLSVAVEMIALDWALHVRNVGIECC